MLAVCMQWGAASFFDAQLCQQVCVHAWLLTMACSHTYPCYRTPQHTFQPMHRAENWIMVHPAPLLPMHQFCIGRAQSVEKIMLWCARQVQQGDTVNTGLGGNNILQRFKLNGQAALITGATCAVYRRR